VWSDVYVGLAITAYSTCYCLKIVCLEITVVQAIEQIDDVILILER